jgi:hypothetical protein
MDGYRTVHRNLYLQPGATMKMHETMVPLAAGETSAPPEVAPPVPAPPEGTYNAPRGQGPQGDGAPPIVRRGDGRVPPEADEVNGFGTLVLHVQPREAHVSIDGQRWLTSSGGDFEVRLPAGPHHVEVDLQGFQRFSSDIAVRDGAPTPMNVSLTGGR